MAQNLLTTPLKEIIFNIFDTESTGNNSFREDKPIELAYLLFNLSQGVIKHYQTIIDTDLVIHPAAIMTHGITNEEFKNMSKISYSEMLNNVQKDFENNIHIAHNISFDYSMIPELKDKNSFIDTLIFAKKLYKIGDFNEDNMPLTSHKMQELRYWLKIEVDTMGFEAHRALADILVTANVFKTMLNKYFDLTRNPDSTLQDLYDFINAEEAPKLIENCSFKKFEGQLFSVVIKECLLNGDNYFDWLLDKLNDDPVKNKDLIFTINHWFSEYNYDPRIGNKKKKDFVEYFKKK